VTKKIHALLVIAALAALSVPAVQARVQGKRTGAPVGVAAATTKAAAARLPLAFEENRGQVAGPAAYIVHGRGASASFDNGGVSLAVKPGARVRATFVDAATVAPVARDQLPGKVNYFRGRADQWVTDVPTFSTLEYKGLWNGIDLTYAGNGTQLEYTFTVAPGADADRIGINFTGADRLRIERDGGLAIETARGVIHESKPIAFQDVDGTRVPVASHFVVDGTSYGFDVGTYDPRLPLVIDPKMFVYAGYIGGSDFDGAVDVAADGAGNAYVAGFTFTSDGSFPDGDGFGSVPGADTTFNGGFDDAFVAKINAAGTALLYASFFGGSDQDLATAVATDGSGRAYLTGLTLSSQSIAVPFPLLNPADSTYGGGGGDGFVARFTPSGALEYSTYLGGSATEFSYSIAVANNDAVVAGVIQEGDGDFATAGAFDTIDDDGNDDGFVARLNSTGSTLVYATYLGGDGKDAASDVAVDAAGNAYVAGFTYSRTTFPLLNAAEPTFSGGTDGFVTKLNPTGTALVYSTFVGGEDYDELNGIDVDATGAAVVVGDTYGGYGYPTVGAADSTYNGSRDSIVTKLSPAGNTFVFSGFLGGDGNDMATAAGFTPAGDVWVTGSTDSAESTFPDGDGFGALPGADTTANGGQDAFAANLSSTGAITEATFIGGSAQDGPGLSVFSSFRGGLAVRGAKVFVAGITASTAATFPDGDGIGTLTSFDATPNGSVEGFVVALGGGTPPDASVDKSCGPDVASPGDNVTCTLSISVADADATNLTVSDDRPTGTTLVGTATGGGFSCTTADPMVCTKAAQPAGTTSVITYALRVDDNVASGASLVNTVSVAVAETETNLANNTDAETTTTPACTQTYTGNIPTTLRLTGPGLVCIKAANVTGGVSASNVGLRITNSTIAGLSGSNVDLRMTGSSVTGAFSLTGGGPVRICGSTLSNNASISNAIKSVAVGDPASGCAGNVAKASLVANSNTGGLRIAANQITGSLVCNGNAPAPTNGGSPNTVSGGRSGQCVGAF
jgi:hypothetical protein